jgi:hypothetical protein
VFKRSETLQQVKLEKTPSLAHGIPMMTEAAQHAAQNRAQQVVEP